MSEMRKIKKKIKENRYEIADIEYGFEFDNEYFLSFLIYEVAKKKIISEKIIFEIRNLAQEKKEVSNRSISGIFTIKVTACAALMKFGFNDEYENLTEEEKEVVSRILDYKDWKDIN